MKDSAGDVIEYGAENRIDVDEYVRFLKGSDLGTMYPRKRFLERVGRLLRNADVVVTAREAGGLVGVCLGLTDFAYFLYITDLGVSRTHVRRGIGRNLVRLAWERAGGADDICVVTWSNVPSLPFYADSGITERRGLVGSEAAEWDLFDVREQPEP